jgi:hypothetical protein
LFSAPGRRSRGGHGRGFRVAGGYFKTDGRGLAEGYYHANGSVPSAIGCDGGGYPKDSGGVLEPLGQHSFFTGHGTGQQFGMRHATPWWPTART